MRISFLVELVVIFVATVVPAFFLGRPILVFFVSVIVAYIYFVASMGCFKKSTQLEFAIGWAFVPTSYASVVCAVAATFGWLGRELLST